MFGQFKWLWVELPKFDIDVSQYKKDLTKLEHSHDGLALALSAPKPDPTRFDITNRCSGAALAFTRVLISQPQRYAYLDGPFGPEGETQNNSERGRERLRIPRDSGFIHLGEEF